MLFLKGSADPGIGSDYGLSSRTTAASARFVFATAYSRGDSFTSRRSTSPSRRGRRSCRQERRRPGSDRSWLAPVVNMYVICSNFVLKSTEQSSTAERFRVVPEARVKERLTGSEERPVMPGIHRARRASPSSKAHRCTVRSTRSRCCEFALAPSRGGHARGKPAVTRAPTQARPSLVPQRLDGIEPRRAPGRKQRRQERKHKRHGDDGKRLAYLHLGRQLVEEIKFGVEQDGT